MTDLIGFLWCNTSHLGDFNLATAFAHKWGEYIWLIFLICVVIDFDLVAERLDVEVSHLTRCKHAIFVDTLPYLLLFVQLVGTLLHLFSVALLALELLLSDF